MILLSIPRGQEKKMSNGSRDSECGSAISHPDFPSPQTIPSSSAFPFSTRNMDDFVENFDSSKGVMLRDDIEYDSRSGSDNNFDPPFDDGQDLANVQPSRKKKYHRHTPLQIQELENFFRLCPHPDEKQRTDLGKRLSLEPKQVKFWFQNRRTQMKTQLERHENLILRQENDKLRAENSMMKESITNPLCNTCGGPTMFGQVPFEENRLRLENAKLREEINRMCALSSMFLGGSLSSSLANPNSFPPNSISSLELGLSGLNGFNNNANALVLTELNLGDGIYSSSSLVKPEIGRMGNEFPLEKTWFVDLAIFAMDELVKMAQSDGPLWIKSLNGRKETLNRKEYNKTFRSCIRSKPNNWVSEATRDANMVIINSLALVETLMDANRWAEMFPCLIARASTIDIISGSMDGTCNGTIQLMYAELQVLSPLVSVRPIKFLRFCKQHAEGVWVVVDVSIDLNSNPYLNCRKLPSGCIVQDMPNGYSKVTWIEHIEYDECLIHPLYQNVISSGLGFGANRWLTTLQRQCECVSILMSSSNNPSEDPSGMTMSGRRSMLKLARRMVDNFCSGICASTARKWDKLVVDNVSQDVKMMARKSLNDPGEPPGIVLSAATSVWMPVSPQRLFGFLQDGRLRSEWDVLSNGGTIQEVVHIAKGHDTATNCVSLLRSNPHGNTTSTMLILQETWVDPHAGSLVVYAPVDTQSVNMVMNGGDSGYVPLLPSGFAILPQVGPELDKVGNRMESSGCLLTVGFQILVNGLPTAKITVESIETVNNLISCTIDKIKAALN